MFSDSVALSFVLFTPCAAAFNFSFLNVLQVGNNHSLSCLIHELVKTNIFLRKPFVCLLMRMIQAAVQGVRDS